MRWILCGGWLALAPAAVVAADKPIPGYEGETKRILVRHVEACRAAKTYQDRSVRSFDFEYENKPEKDPKLGGDQEARLIVARPGKFVYESAGQKLVCDGKTLWNHRPEMHQYIESEVPKAWSIEREDDHSLISLGIVHRPAQSLLTSLSPEELFKQVVRFEAAKTQDREGKKAVLVRGAMRTAGEDETPFEFWFDAKTGMLLETAFDVTGSMGPTKAASEQRFGVKIKRIISRIRYHDIKLDETIPTDAFTFKPGEDDEKVDEFRSDMDAMLARQKRLIGKPAPAFKGKTLEGKDVSLADFKGKVVMLDFWATWCGPCVAAIPDVQKISEKYAEKSKGKVVVLGMNCDDAGDEKTVKDFVKDKGITFKHFLDSERKAREAYFVPGIPCTVVIDAKGIVRSIELGGHSVEDMSGWIDEALSAKSAEDRQEPK